MSTSFAQIEANRSNAQSSTGPRTPEGKQRSASNSLRHGLTAQNPLLPTEDPEAYRKFCDEYVADLKPKGAIEQQLALSMAGMQWRLNRCHEIEQSILDFEPGPAQIDSLNKFSLYEHRLSRSFHATLKQFLEIKSARRQQEEKDLKDAASILGHLRSKKIAYDPAEDGFVFSLAEVDQWMRRRDNIDDADKARMMAFNSRFFGRAAGSSAAY